MQLAKGKNWGCAWWAGIDSRVRAEKSRIGNFFPPERLSTADYVLGATFTAICFALFFHNDMWGVGWDSLNYLFGDPLEFYENCKKYRGGGQNMLGTPYPPAIYLIFALWLYPFKLLGLIEGPQTFPLYLTYWLKVLTTLVYAASAMAFYRIALQYCSDKQWAKYSTAAWLTMPLAFFSQFVFSQYDVFYVLLVLAGFLLFLRGGVNGASLCFGLAITFKYFPAFAYLPLLLLFEKRIWRIAVSGLIFIVPLFLMNQLYAESPAFVEGVKNHVAINRVFAVAMDFGGEFKGFRIYLLFASFGILCGLAYFMDLAGQARARAAAYLWLVASILPFLFIFWHPQWVISFAPAIVLTSMISPKRDRFMMLDIIGMFLFIATVTLIFQYSVDAALFKAAWLGIDFKNSFLMGQMFRWFGGHSFSVFWSGFWAYLVLQIILKHRLLMPESVTARLPPTNYGEIRRSLYIGLMMYLLPAAIAVYVDLKRNESFTANLGWGGRFGELWGGRSFEQTFVANGTAIKRVSLLFSTFDRQNIGDVAMEIVDDSGNKLARTSKPVGGFQDNGWEEFTFDSVPVSKTSRYTVRLTAPAAAVGNAISWWGSPSDTYPEGTAIVDGASVNADFAFRVGFEK